MQRDMVHEQGGGGSHHHQHQLPRFGNGNGAGAGAVAGAATGVARASKKNKPKKVPQRGLGVAQLEKLRIEEQKKMDQAGAATAMSVTGASHLGVGAGGGLGHLLPMHPPPPPLSLSALPRPGADGVHCGYPPVLWDPAAAADPMKHPYKRNLCPQPPLPTVSTGLSLTAPASHPTEPPSNQMYSCSSVSRSSAAAADEDRVHAFEAAGVDRSWPFMFEGLNTTAFRTTMGKAPPFAAARTTTREAAVAGGGLPDVCPDLSRYEFRATNYFSSNASYSDCWSSEFGHCKMSSKENEAAYLTLNAQHTPRMKQQQQPPPVLPSIHLPLPEFGDFGIMQSQNVSASASSSSAAAAAARPFYSFMPVGPVRCERPLSEIKADASDSIDLELKL